MGINERLIALDTETTGFSFNHGDKLIEIGAVELVRGKLTGEKFHKYVNPGREIDEGAIRVHGITLERLVGEPKFEQIADEFLAFIKGADLVIHNANFDLGFLNNELGDLGKPKVEDVCNNIIDSLREARMMHRGEKNSLDALCKRYKIDNSNREKHGALLDAQLLAEVYMAMMSS